MKTNNGPNTDLVAYPTVLLFFKRYAIQLLSSVFCFINKMRTIYLLFHEIHSGVQACKLAPDIGHLSGKFEGFDWRILSLTGHVDWALPL